MSQHPGDFPSVRAEIVAVGGAFAGVLTTALIGALFNWELPYGVSFPFCAGISSFIGYRFFPRARRDQRESAFPAGKLTLRNALVIAGGVFIGWTATCLLIPRFLPEIRSWMDLSSVLWLGVFITVVLGMDFGRTVALTAAGITSTILLGSAATLAASKFFSMQPPVLLVIFSWFILSIFLVPASRKEILKRWRQRGARGKSSP